MGGETASEKGETRGSTRRLLANEDAAIVEKHRKCEIVRARPPFVRQLSGRKSGTDR